MGVDDRQPVITRQEDQNKTFRQNKTKRFVKIKTKQNKIKTKSKQDQNKTFRQNQNKTKRFVRYIGRTSSGKSNIQCTTYLKTKHKTNEHNGERRPIYNNLTTLCKRTKINWLKTHIHYEIFILRYILGKMF